MVRTRYWPRPLSMQLFAPSMARGIVVNETSQRDAGLPAVPSVVAWLWSLVTGMRRSAVICAAVYVAGIMAALAIQPEPGRSEGVTSLPARVLVLSAQAQRYLFLQYRSYATEFMGCMIGTIRGDAVIVERIAPADVDPAQSTPTYVLPRQTCEDAGWAGTVGVIHSHPDGERCFYYFPGTRVATSDAASFARQPYPVDAIMCGHRVVWISRDMVGQELKLTEHRTPSDLERAQR